MPFVEINVKNEIEKQRQNNPEFKKAWDESQCHLDKDYTKNSVYRNMYPVLFL